MKNKIQSFQLIRAVAITLIFLSHCENLMRINDINCLKYLGGAGVSIFIALSGFLTAKKYDDLDNSSAIVLYKRRWKQFYKNHYFTFVLSVPLTIGVLKRSIFQWLVQLVANLSLTQSLIPISSVYFSFNAVSWYLSLML